MHPVMRLFEDVVSSNAFEVRLPALPRMIFVTHGSMTIADRIVSEGEAWHGSGEVSLKPGKAGVACWRWEVSNGGIGGGAAAGPGIASHQKLSAMLETVPKGELLMRGDSVGFPPGGCAYLHTHQGPGIRCLIEGGIRIDTHGRSTSYGPGSAWFESGPDPVFAQAAPDRPSRFIRVMILPRALAGKSSLALVNEEDKAKPRSQQYKIYVDAPIEWPKA